MDDLIAELRNRAAFVEDKLCDLITADLMRDAADALAAARTENERLRAVVELYQMLMTTDAYEKQEAEITEARAALARREAQIRAMTVSFTPNPVQGTEGNES